MLAIKRSISTGIESKITMEDVYSVGTQMKSSVSTEDIEKLKNFEKQFS